MLIKTIEEVRAVCKVPLALKYASLNEDIEEAELKYLVPALGHTLYAALESVYQAGQMDDEGNASLKALLPYSQRVIANMAVAEAIDYLQVQITETGVQRVEKADEKSAYHYQKLEAQDYYARKGFNGVERLLIFLEQQPSESYPSWRTSSAYTRRKEMFIPDAATFDQYCRIDESRRTYLALVPIMKRVEEFKIRETIGAALYDKLKSEIIDPETPISAESKTLIAKIQPAVAHLSMALGCQELAMSVTPVGVVVSSRLASGGATEEKKSPERDRLDLMYTRASGSGEKYLSEVKNFLLQQASEELYPDFYNSPLYPKSVAEEEKPKGKIYGAL